jgi:hypothetical protein
MSRQNAGERGIVGAGAWARRVGAWALRGVMAAAGMGAAAAPALAQCATCVPHEWVVRIRGHGTATTMAQVLADYQAELVSVGPSGLFIMRTPATMSDDQMELLIEADARIDAEENRLYLPPEPGTQSFFLRTIGPDFLDQPARTVLNLPAAHALTRGRFSLVAVVDTGVSPHPALADNLIEMGYNFVDQNQDTREWALGIDSDGDGVPDSKLGHGTMVAGVIAMVAPGAHIVPIKVMDADGVGTAYSLAEGVRYAMSLGVDVINISMASADDSFFVHEAVQAAVDQGIVVVASVGNNASQMGVPGYNAFPAAVSGVIAVAATDDQGVKAGFSDFGSPVTLCAPGVGVVSLLPDGDYAFGDGASFAAPMVSGVAALLKSDHARTSVSRITAFLKNSALTLDGTNPGFTGMLGAGLVQPEAAILAGAASATCRLDYNDDHHINLDDLQDFITDIYTVPPPGSTDFNRDLFVNLDDLGDFITVFYSGGCGE